MSPLRIVGLVTDAWAAREGIAPSPHMAYLADGQQRPLTPRRHQRADRGMDARDAVDPTWRAKL